MNGFLPFSPELPVAARILEYARLFPTRPAVIADEKTETYGAFAAKITGFAAVLRQKGVSRGDRVLVLAVPSAVCVACYYAVHLCGGVLVPAEKTAGEDRLAELARRTAAKLAVLKNEVPDAEIPCVTFDALVAAARAEETPPFNVTAAVAAISPEDPCEMIFTTGTTGKSKGVLISHRAMAYYAEAVRKTVELRPGTRFLLTTPLNHAGGLRRTHLLLGNGCAMAFRDGMSDLKGYFDDVARYGITALYLPPVSIRIILSFASATLAKYADQIEFVYSSSSPLPAGDCEALRALLPRTRLYNAYEASETPGVCAYDYNTPAPLAGCLGRANAGVELAVLPQGASSPTAAPGVRGRICVKSPMNMLGYDGEPALTASVFLGGWFVSGDLGELDAGGRLYYTGREGDVINIGGYKISPTEVEEVALLAPGVRECVCVMALDAFRVPYLKLLIVPEGEPDPVGIGAFLSRRLEAYKVPRKIETTDAIRKTFNGKIDRKAYR